MRSRLVLVPLVAVAICGCISPAPDPSSSAALDARLATPSPAATWQPSGPPVAPTATPSATAAPTPTAIPSASPGVTRTAAPTSHPTARATSGARETTVRTPAPTQRPEPGFSWTRKSRVPGMPVDTAIVATGRGFVLWTPDSLHHSRDLRVATTAPTGDVDWDWSTVGGVARGADRVVAVGETWSEDPTTGDGTSEPLLLLSPDGAAWEHYRDPGLGAGGLEAVAWVGGTFVITGWITGEGSAMWVSPDGMLLERLPGDEAARIAGGLQLLAGDGTELLAFVGMGDPDDVPTGVEVWRTMDGRAWQRVGRLPRSAAASITEAVRGNGSWVAAGYAGEAGRVAVWTSPDGLAWTRSTTPIKAGELADLVGYGSGFVATGWSGDEPGSTCGSGAPYVGRTWTSPDGQIWRELPRTPGVAMWTLAVLGNRLVGLGVSDHDWTARRWSGRLPASLADQWPLATGRLPAAQGGCGP